MSDTSPMPDLFAGLPELARARLAGASVLLVGAGNIGSPLAAFLARSGIRLLRIVDRDHVEGKNLLTQEYQPQDVGQSKAEVLAERLRRQVPTLTVEAYPTDLEDLPHGAAEVDLILGALDSRRARQILVSEIAWPLGVSVVDGGVGEGFRGRVQVFVPREGGACLECTWNQDDYRQLVVEYPCIPGQSASAPPTAAPAFVGSVVAGMMTAEAVKVLGGQIPERSQEIAFDLFHQRHLLTRLRHNPQCRFDHEIVERVVDLEKPFAQVTVQEVLTAMMKCSEGQRVHLEWRRQKSASSGFAGTRLLAREELERDASRSLQELGFVPEDRIRVRTQAGSFFIRLDGRKEQEE